jgi:hypothetical protein
MRKLLINVLLDDDSIKIRCDSLLGWLQENK